MTACSGEWEQERDRCDLWANLELGDEGRRVQAHTAWKKGDRDAPVANPFLSFTMSKCVVR